MSQTENIPPEYSQNKNENRNDLGDANEDGDNIADMEVNVSGQTPSSSLPKREDTMNKEKSILLELGDIIEITASNMDVNEQVFYVMYIDNHDLKLFNISTRNIVSFTMDDEGGLSDESITSISLLNRSEVKGFARQNKLLPQTWVDIHFGGEIPTIIVGEITNLEEDMIEVITFPEMKTIYIDFGYKGIPQHIPIDKIVIRDKPSSLGKTASLAELNREDLKEEEWTEQASIEFTDNGESVITIPKGVKPDANVREVLHKMYVQASDILEEDLGEITQLVEVPEWQKKYSLETQTSDMMEHLLSNIPDNKRTARILNHIHFLTNRFSRLRAEFSVFDDIGNVVNSKWVGSLKKPIVDHILELDKTLHWIVPVVIQKRKLYVDDKQPTTMDTTQRDLGEDLEEQQTIVSDFQNKSVISSENKYLQWMSKLQPHLTPFEPPNTSLYNEEILVKHKRVQEALEGIVNNLEQFQSHVVKEEALAKRKFVIQRYCLGETRNADKLLRSGRKIIVKQPVSMNDEICIQSLLMFPKSVMEFSKVYSHTSSIARKSILSQFPFLKSMALKNGKNIQTHLVEQLDKEIDYEGEEGLADEFMKGIKHYVLEEGIPMEENTTFEQFLKVIFPKTRTFIKLVRQYIKNEFSFVSVVKELEPFGIYSKHITFPQYMEIRYFIKEQIKEHKKIIQSKSKEFLGYLTSQYSVLPAPQRIGEMFKESVEMLGWMKDAYKLNDTQVNVMNAMNYNKPPVKNEEEDYGMQDRGYGMEDREYLTEGGGMGRSDDYTSREPDNTFTSSELLQKLYDNDGAQLYSKMICYLLLSLITPDKLMSSLEPPNIEDMTDAEKKKVGDCNLRVIAKKYTSISQLQKDNNREDVFFDKEYDDTPYSILSKYKEEKKSKTPSHFLEYLEEVLISKHDCPPSLAPQLAKTLVAGKKEVEEGHYALVLLRPNFTPDVDITKLNAKEREEAERESELRTRTQYYKRLGDNWIHDASVGDETFVDTNAMFCNIDNKCSYTPSELVDKCLPNSIASLKMKTASQNRIRKELDNRYEMTVEQLEKHLTETILSMRKHVRNGLILREAQLHKQNDISVAIGKQLIRPDEEKIVSPHLGLRDLILSQDDFVKKQYDIVRYVEMFTREAMETELNETPHWRYCIKTNTPLFPVSHYELASAFVYQPENYQTRLDIVCRENGKKEDNMIVDKHSGWVLKYLDLEVEEQYDDAGFKIKSHSLIEKDLSALILEAISNKDKVFENPDAQKIYNIFLSLSTNTGLKKDAMDAGLEEFVMRVSMELINNKNAVVIPSEQAYNKRLEKEKEKQRKTTPPPYSIYRDELIIIIVSSVLFVGIQSMIPSFKTTITFPGCVQSFGGYPLEAGMENTSCIKYLSCILEKIRGSHSSLWKSVSTLKSEAFEKRIVKIIQDFLMVRQDIHNLYIIKREYLVLHPEGDIPTDAVVSNKWPQFQPPLVATNMSKTLVGIPAEYEDEIINAMRNGSKSQHDMMRNLKTKLLKHAYGIVETINHIVQTKNALFLTSSKNPYLQNACCNEDPKKIIPLHYFIEENANIETYIRKSIKMAALLHKVQSITRGDMFYHEPSTANVYPLIPSGFEIKSVYEAFIHYCKLDSDIPIPKEFLPLCSEKPREYDRRWSVEEKIEYMKRIGRNYTVEDLHQLMLVVNRNNLLPGIYIREVSLINKFKDILEHLELKQSVLIEEKIRGKLWEVLKHYNPHVMVSVETECELNEALRQLNNVLSTSNHMMLDEILEFISKYSGVSNSEYNKIEKFITEVDVWKLEDASTLGKDVREHTMYTVNQYIKNEVFYMSKTAPSVILNDGEYTHIPKHWNLSQLHKTDIASFVKPQATKLNAFKKNAQITQLLQKLQPILTDLVSFLDNLPLFSPIYKQNTTFYSLFSPENVKLLLKHVWYSCLYEYVNAAKHTDLIRVEYQTARGTSDLGRMARVQKDTAQLLDEIFGEEQQDVRVGNETIIDLQEVEIIAGDKSEMFKKIAKLLCVYCNVAQTNKKLIDIPYSQLVLGVGVTQMNEKKKITDFFENMEKEERRVQYQLKTLKLGDIWSEGLRKSIFEYDKNAYDKSREQTQQYFVSDLNNFGIDIDIGLAEGNPQQATTAEELAEEERNNIQHEYDGEGEDISGLRSGFMDGNVYSEDEGDDDFGEM